MELEVDQEAFQERLRDSEPVHIPPEIPSSVFQTQKVAGVRWVAGEGNRDARVLFIATSVLEEEEMSYQEMQSGKRIYDPPAVLKGGTGQVLRNISASLGVSVEDNYYTTWVKWLAPRDFRLKPSKGMIEAGEPAIEAEIKEIDPDVIVVFGKPVFQALTGRLYSLRDAIGCWFDCNLGGKARRVYPMECVTTLVTRPDHVARFEKDLKEVKRMLSAIDGLYVPSYEEKYETIRNSKQLTELVERLSEQEQNVISVDCEWHGANHRMGQLRSFQMCWAPGEAAYIRFMDDKLNYAFDVSYEEAGKILSKHLDKPEVKYIGHHISADLPWMSHVLGLEWYDKSIFDTEFAQQCADEAAELGLERLGMAYTDLGRYDIELLEWKKSKRNQGKTKDGYGLIPDRILIKYAQKDVDTVMRSYQHIKKKLDEDHGGRLGKYYDSIFNPFVTNAFTSFTLKGLPVDLDRMDFLRDLYTYARDISLARFRSELSKEADSLLREKLYEFGCESAEEVVDEATVLTLDDRIDEAMSVVFSCVDAAKHVELKPFWEYFVIAPGFETNKIDHKKLLLFEVKGYDPVKTTAQKEKGVPSIPWEKVKEMPEEKQKLFKPSTDTQTLKILHEQHKDSILDVMMDYISIGTVCKSFLKQPITDPDSGAVLVERGLHSFVDKKEKLLTGNYSTTETGRPRSWKPNTLNLPGWVNGKISSAVVKALEFKQGDPEFPEQFRPILEGSMDIPSVRSIVTAPEGWCIVESDYATAELRAWAYISGCQDMIDLLTKPDPHIALVKPGATDVKGAVCRLSFPPYITSPNKEEYLMTYTVEGECKARFTEDDLLRDVDGNVVNYKQDLHWSLAEMVNQRPREEMKDKAERSAAKAGNFQCIAADELVLTKRGPVKIQEVMCCDLLWDGVEWVSHDGVICTGEKHVTTYQGLSATDNHEVWTEEEGKVSFGYAKNHSLHLTRAAGPSTQSQEPRRPEGIPRDRRATRTRLFSCPYGVRLLRGKEVERPEEHGERLFLEMQMSKGNIPLSAVPSGITRCSAVFVGALQCYETTLRDRYSSFFSSLQRSWDKSVVQRSKRLCGLGAEYLARRGLRWKGLRQNRQRWSLLQREPSSCIQNGQCSKQRSNPVNKHRDSSRGSEEVPTDNVYREHGSRKVVRGYESGGDSGVPQQQPESSRKTKVYDILNAGPRHRYTCSGVLVSNSAYGSSGNTLERAIEADTGIPQVPGTGDKLLAALEQRQPQAFNFMYELEKVPVEKGFLVAGSGRVRHFVMHDMDVLGWKRYNRQLAGLGREARNFYMQESVAATACRAVNWLFEFRKIFQLTGRPIAALYDSVVTVCPAEERHVWKMAHDLFMWLGNGWLYHGRVLRYPIDTDLHKSWSYKIKDEEKQAIESVELSQDKNVVLAKQWLDDQIEQLNNNEILSVLGMWAALKKAKEEINI